MGKNFRGLNICAKTLIFGILTLDRLFLKCYTAIFLILIFLPDMACESCLNWQKNGKNRHFSTLKVQKEGEKSTYQKFPHNVFEEPYGDATYKISVNFDEYCSFQIFFRRIFLSIFCPLWPPQFLNFASQILKNNNSSWKTYWKSRVYHLGNIHAKF